MDRSERDALVEDLTKALQGSTPPSWWASEEVIRWRACARAVATTLKAHGLIFDVEEFMDQAEAEVEDDET